MPEDLRREYILSPEGLTYRSRVVAILDMFKRGCRPDDTEVMKVKMVNYENWEKSTLLPTGWIFKKICEGFDMHKNWYSNFHYLSREGQVFDSMRKVTEHLQSTPGYDQKDGERCKEFIQEQKPAEIKHEWNEGDNTLPKGWKMRVSEGELEISFLFSRLSCVQFNTDSRRGRDAMDSKS